MKSVNLFYSLVIIAVVGTIQGLENVTVYGSVNDEPDWTTYENSQYDISFDYPKHYQILGEEVENADSLPFLIFSPVGSPPDYGTFSFSVDPNNMTLQEFVDKDIANDGGIAERTLVGDINPITISDNLSGFSYSFNSNSIAGETVGKAVIFNTDKYVYILEQSDSVGPNSDIFDHMIESIEVTED